MNHKKQFTRLAALALLGISLAGTPAVFAQTADKPFTYVEQMPQFKGGEQEMLKHLGTNIQYPAEAKANGVEGLVVLQFVVERDGSISEVQALKKLGFGTDEEAIRVIKSMSGLWTAGRQNGKQVRVRYTLPIRFSLNESDKAESKGKSNRLPQYKGGQEAMAKAMRSFLKLPEEANKENLNARVILKFNVDKDGSVTDIRLDGTKLKKTVGPGSELDYMDASTFNLQNKTVLARLSEAAVAAVRATSGNWEPALQNGQAVTREVTLPIEFLGAENKGNDYTHSVPAMTKDTYTFEETDVKPIFQDGPLAKFLAKNLRYPKNIAFEGDCNVSFTIKPDGSVTGPHMSFDKKLSKEDRNTLHQEFTKVISLMDGKWSPGKVNGHAVSTVKELTVRFVTDGNTEKAPVTTSKPDVVVTRYR